MADVQGLITAAQGYAATTLEQATEAFDVARSALEDIGYTSVGYSYANLPQAPNINLNLTPPALSSITLTLPTPVGEAPVFQAVAPIVVGPSPTLSATPPTPVSVTRPTTIGGFGISIPAVDLSAQFPAVPSQLVNPTFTEPTLGTYVTPVAPVVSLPAFAGVRPTGEPVAPDDLAAKFGNAYASAGANTVNMVNGYVDDMLTKYNPQFHTQMARIEAQLTKYLDGGTGLKPAVEDAIYSRARGKNDAESRRVRDAAYGEAASRGFTLPSGALMSAMQTARQAGADANAKAASEIVVMQAEMEQKNLQFAVTTSTGLRTAMVNASLGYLQSLVTINGQAIDYAKSLVNMMVEVFNGQVKLYTVKWEGYKADAQVFTALIQGALAQVQVYEAEIKALGAMVQVDTAKVNMYRSRIDALQSFASVYKAQVDAVVSKASLEKLKIDLFQAQVQAYSAQVQAKNAEWQGYSAELNGEEAKIRMYTSQVQAYQAAVMGFKADIEAKAEVVRAQNSSNIAVTSLYSARVQAYGASVQAVGEVARTQLDVQKQQIMAFQVQTGAAVAQFQAQSDYYKAVSLIGVENAKLLTTSRLADSQNKLAYGKAIAEISAQQAGTFSQLAGSAMSGMNSLASEIKYE